MAAIYRFDGAITASAFTSGDAIVVGAWARSPFGMFIDVMWRRADGTRALLAPTAQVAEYVDGLYDFDDVSIVPISGRLTADHLVLSAPGLQFSADIGPQDWRSWVFALRPRALRTSRLWLQVEDLVARPLAGPLLGGGDGVRTAGVAPGGVREWYGAHDWRALSTASASVDGTDCGPMADMPADLGVGLSAFPPRPASVRVTTLVERADGDR